MSTREHINEYFNGRPFALLCALALMAMSAVALSSGLQPPTGHSAGIFFTLKDELIESGPLAVAANLLCMLAIGGIMLAVNKVYNFVRSVTHLFVSSFFLLQMANPWSLATFNVGSLLVLVTALSILPLFASYQDRHSQRNVFVVENGIAVQKEVSLGRHFDGQYEILSGLEEGEQVVVKGGSALRNGAQVEVIE